MNASNQTLRARALETLTGNWSKPMLAMLVVMLVSGISVIPGIGFIISLVISGPLTLGMTFFLLEFSKNRDADISLVFSGFNRFTVAFLTYLLMLVFIVLWTLALIIPGIIAAISYSQAFYLLARNPDMTAMEAIDKSKQIMNGHKGRYFMLGLSFIGWFILSVITCGIGFLWSVPYYQMSLTKFHQDLYGDATDGAATQSISNILDA